MFVVIQSIAHVLSSFMKTRFISSCSICLARNQLFLVSLASLPNIARIDSIVPTIVYNCRQVHFCIERVWNGNGIKSVIVSFEICTQYNSQSGLITADLSS